MLPAVGMDKHLNENQQGVVNMEEVEKDIQLVEDTVLYQIVEEDNQPIQEGDLVAIYQKVKGKMEENREYDVLGTL